MASIHPFLPRAEREPEDLIGLQEMPVELDDESGGIVDLEGARQTPLADGGFEIDFDPGIEEQQAIPEDANEHYANIAQFLSPSQLSTIAQEVLEMVEADENARKPWFERAAKGLESLGVVDEGNVKPPFKGASTVTHPLIAEAIVQFQARSLKELWPATGPAKGAVMGARSREKVEQAQRVEDYLNYQSTIEDPIYYPESDKLLWLVGFEGNAFRKSYNDPLTGKNVRRLVRAEEFIVPYSATTLQDAPRFAHVLYYTQNEMKRLQKQGFFLDIPLQEPAGRSENDLNPLAEGADQAEGKTDPDERPEDRDHTAYEANVYYEVPGFEDPDGLALPWVITVERDTQAVLAIRRGWRESDPMKARRLQFTHYPFIRGDGFYAYGLIHLAGGLGKAATGALRVILDNAAFAAVQGGFKSKDAKLPANVELEPGVWADTECTAEELQKAFYTPPWNQVPEAMFKVLGLLTELGQRFVSTTETTVGDASNTGPVGTTVALIEQGSKVHTAIHSRLHVALGEELRLLSELNGEYLPEEGYPYEVPNESREIFRADFDERVDVIPVSDPNIFSQTQRIAQAQTAMQMAESAPDLYDRREAHRRMLDAIRMPDIEQLLVTPGQVPRCDPVTENTFAMVGKPIKVFLDQDHDAHVAVHMGQLQMLLAQGSPSAEMFQQLIMPHIAEHEALGARMKLMMSMGVPLPPIDLDSEQPPAELPPHVENMIAKQAAMVMQGLMQQLKQAQAQAEGAPAAEEGAAAEAQAQSEERRRDESFVREEKRKDLKTRAEIERKDAMAGIDPATVRSAGQYLKERGLDRVITPRRLAVVSRELGRSFDEVLRMLMREQSGGQGMGVAPLTMPAIRR